MAHDTGHTDDHDSEFVNYAHVVPIWVLFAVFAALMVLTFITVAVTWVDLGPWNLWIAMGIATVKATLVALYFMHLRYDNPVNALILIAALGALFLFISLSMLDSTTYQPDIQLYQATVD
jgi:cytochrome c oxidase subunit 4